MAKYNTKDDVIFKSIDYVYDKYKLDQIILGD